jgi:HEPN domain-containing protein
VANRDKHVRRFQPAADQRLTTAEFLLENDFHLDAVYLAGYAVECAMKALILRWTSKGKFADMLQQLTEVGAKGHDFEYLKGLLKQQRGGSGKKDAEILGELARQLKEVTSWSTDLRYQVGTVRPKEAQAFLRAARAIRDLCARG